MEKLKRWYKCFIRGVVMSVIGYVIVDMTIYSVKKLIEVSSMNGYEAVIVFAGCVVFIANATAATIWFGSKK